MKLLLIAILFFCLLTGSAAADKVILQLCWDHQFQFAGYYAAAWQGYFSEVGLDVEIRPGFSQHGDLVNPIDEVTSHRTEFGVAAGELLRAGRASSQLVALAPFFQESPLIFYGPADLQLESPADLARKRIGMFARGNTGEFAIKIMLHKAGLDLAEDFPKFVIIRNGPRDIAAGRVDLAAGYTIERDRLEQLTGGPLAVLKPSNFGVNFYGDTLFTRRSLAEQNPELVKAFVDASKKGWRFALAHSDRVIERIVRDLPRTLPVQDLKNFNRNQASIVATYTHFPVVSLAKNDPKRWREVHDSLKSVGVASGAPPSRGFVFDPQRDAAERKRYLATGAFVLLILAALAAVVAWVASLRGAVKTRTKELEAEIAERKLIEKEIERSDNDKKLILNAAGEGIYGVDLDGQIKFANPAAAEMVGWKVSELLGKTQHDVIHHSRADGTPYPPQDCAIYAAMADGELHHGCDEVFWRKDGSYFPVEFKSRPIRNENNAIVGAVVTFNDISERKAMERQLVQSQKMEVVGQLTGGVAHDFNNLLAIISGNVELIEMELSENAGLMEHIRRTMSAIERGANLTQHLLAFSRQQTLSPRPTDLTQLTAEFMDILTRTLTETVEIKVKHEEGVWPVLVDPHQLESAILNLAVNARDAMPDGGVLTIETRKARLDESDVSQIGGIAAGEYVILSVSDTGIGISAQDLEHVFEPFFTTKEVGKGSGLGLSMVYGFVRQSGGQVAVESRVGVGTTVRVYLPRHNDEKGRIERLDDYRGHQQMRPRKPLAGGSHSKSRG